MEATREKLLDRNNDHKAMAVDRPSIQRRLTTLDKRAILSMLIIHLLCLMAPFHFTWPAFWLAFVLYIITGLFGITLSYHRHLAHKSFKLPKWLEYIFAYFGVHAFEGDPIDWVSTHRYHHQFVDTERDPHTPRTQGFWFAHIGWIFDSYGLTKKVISPKQVEDFDERNGKGEILKHIIGGYLKYGRPNNVEDLQKQVYYRFLRRTYILHHFAFALVLYAIGGLPFLTWGMGVRNVYVLHCTLCVNSVCHIWGTRPWNTKDNSKNNWLVALVTFGEGWHNNHHAFEYSARHGLKWWELDVTWLFILFLQAIGLATDLKLPTQHHIQKFAT